MRDVLNQQTFPVYHCQHYLLRQITQQDRSAIFRGLSDPLVTAHYGVSYLTEMDCQEQIDWYRQLAQSGEGIWWAIVHEDAPEQLIGACGIYEIDSDNHNADIGYWLLPKYWGCGVMRACLQRLLQHAFQVLKLNRIEAEVEPANRASAGLLERLGFQHEGLRREVCLKNGRYIDLNYFAILKSEWRSRP